MMRCRNGLYIFKIPFFSNKERSCFKIKTIYEIQRIRQVISEVEGRRTYIIRSPENAAKVAAGFMRGSNNASIVHPSEAFNNSAAIILCHQPSQNTTPSREDIEVTIRLAGVGRIMGIEVLDHLIVNTEAG
jgi:DNA repair protein RadC